VVPGYLIGDEELGKHQLRFEPPIPTIETGNQREDVIANTAQYTRVLEAAIRGIRISGSGFTVAGGPARRTSRRSIKSSRSSLRFFCVFASLRGEYLVMSVPRY
jgi:hypothetical protein